jgi:hypothetical protein
LPLRKDEMAVAGQVQPPRLLGRWRRQGVLAVH